MNFNCWYVIVLLFLGFPFKITPASIERFRKEVLDDEKIRFY
jgi:hypothetical protein